MLTDLDAWLYRRTPETFPYDAVITEFHRVGKHFVDPEVLEQLDRARGTLCAGFDAEREQLAEFLDFALDKYDGRYDNPSYLAVDLLPLPETGEERDRLLALLIADTLRFELAAHDGEAPVARELRPDERIVAKRCRLGVRAIMPVLARLGLAAAVTASDAIFAGRQVCDVVRHHVKGARLVELTALPVSLVHDEYMFIRMLQCYEATFALIAAELRAAVRSLDRGDGSAAVPAINAAAAAMREAAPLWSLVATMQAQAFLTFREFTDGASAIQSRNYKVVESLCRRPDDARLDSPAYRSVPEVRASVLAGQPNIAAALASARLGGDARDLVHSAMDGFESALRKWRQSHYKLAVRMLGERRGTGYTEGVPYLAAVRGLPVFTPAALPAAA